LEPHAAGIRALYVPEAGIVDYARVCDRLAELVVKRGGEVRTRARVTAIRPGAKGVEIRAAGITLEAGALINCAGLHSDRVTRLSGAAPSARIVPFRGEYYELVPEARELCRNLIYPVPDPRFPFLGVHFTRSIDGGVECGPNAVLALSREGYSWSRINLGDLLGSLAYPGFLRLARKYLRTGLGEVWRSLSKRAFVRALQRLVPEIQADMLVPAPAGVRAQAVTPQGALADDFLIQRQGAVINVLNAPSPAATASLEIGRILASELDDLVSIGSRAC
jgi:L-2-hydroxyglutarate oxidase